MKTFTCLFTDSRSSVPNLSFYVTRDIARARELARRELRDNLHYTGFELSTGNRQLVVEGAFEEQGRQNARTANSR